MAGSRWSRKQDYPKDCAGLEGEATYECLEQRFWDVLRVDLSLESRQRVHEMMTTHIEAAEPVDGEDRWLSRLYFQRGQLSMAIAIEDEPSDAIAYIGSVQPDFERASELDPDNKILPTWSDSMSVALAQASGDREALDAALDQAYANVEDCPLGNIPSITGTTIGLPMETGAPQRSIALLESWDCDAMGWCDNNTWKAPYSAPGLNYHLGEAFARVGRTDEAREYMERSKQAPGFQTWPYRHMTEEALADMDGFVGQFTELGEEGSAFDIVYANSEFGCKFCHQVD